MITAQFVKPEDVVLSAKRLLQSKRLEDPWYYSTFARAVVELAMDAMFDERHKVLKIEHLVLDLPLDIFNLKRVLAYNGDVCTWEEGVKVYWKRNFRRMGNGFSDNQWSNLKDPLMPSMAGIGQVHRDATAQNLGTALKEPPDLLYYDRTQTQIILSDSCARYTHLFLEYDGIGLGDSGWGEIPWVPISVMQAIIDWIVLEGCQILSRTDEYTQGTRDLLKLKFEEVNGMSGSWARARMTVAALDHGAREDLSMYLQKWGHGQ